MVNDFTISTRSPIIYEIKLLMPEHPLVALDMDNSVVIAEGVGGFQET